MKRSFIMENEIGIKVKYNILARIDGKKKYIIYTNYMPADNVLGVRLLAGVVISEEPFCVKELRKREEVKIVDDFLMQVGQEPSLKKRILK